MFGYLRLFSLVSFIAVLAIALLVGMYFRSLASTDLRTMAERGNLAVAQGFSQTIWRIHRATLLPLVGTGQVETSPTLQNFRTDSTSYFGNVAITRAIVYDAAGTILYRYGDSPTPTAQLNRDIADLRGVQQKSRTTIIQMQDNAIAAAAMGTGGKNATGTMVRSLAAITIANATEGYVEIFSDITPQWQKLVLLQWVASGGIITVFFILIWILVLTSKKAEDIISRQHEANMELAAQAAAAQAENREKSLFLANISHELRTPLNAIIGFSEIMKDELMGIVNNTRYQDYINDIHAAGVHLLSLINDILDFSKAEAGKLELEISEVNASKVISNCLRLVSPRSEAAQVEMVDGMPKEALILTTDAKKFKQVLLNLLSNAVKFTPAGGQVRISGWKNVADDSLSFEVRDTGIGIAAKDISRAMSPFGQVDSALSRKYEGTGLGLPLTKKFVELMGGEFTISSEVGAGTTISFTLPREFTATGEVPVKMLM